MSIFSNEPCPKCKTLTASEQEALTIVTKVMVKTVQWRFVCEKCDWTWTNEDQRRSNAASFSRDRKLASMNK